MFKHVKHKNGSKIFDIGYLVIIEFSYTSYNSGASGEGLFIPGG